MIIIMGDGLKSQWLVVWVETGSQTQMATGPGRTQEGLEGSRSRGPCSVSRGQAPLNLVNYCPNGDSAPGLPELLSFQEQLETQILM